MRSAGQIIPDFNAILATLARSVAVRAADVRPATVVRVNGAAQPGPGGLLHAPVSGRPCVWFRVLDVRFNRFDSIPPDLPPSLTSDMGYPTFASSGGESEAVFAIADASGQVLVDPRNADIDAPVVSVDTKTADYGAAPTKLVREWILEAGAPVFVCGGVEDGPVLRATESNCVAVSGRGEAAAAQRAQTVASMRGARSGATSTAMPTVSTMLPIAAIAAATVIVLVVVFLVFPL